MRSKVVQRIIDRTPPDVDIFVRMYADLVLRINSILERKNISQKSLAQNMDKSPSEISKWLNGEHNFTLRSIAKLEAELGEKLIQIPGADERIEYFPDYERETKTTYIYRKPTQINNPTVWDFNSKPISLSYEMNYGLKSAG